MIKFLGLQSTENEKDWVSKGRDSTWKFRVSETEKDPYFDFINNFQNKF
ncbi:MAG: hypothetical protein SFU98_13870 [Leptospiraceae bacterium]|nr:hypothetical protein [Leptospiraceae bacterium]